MKVLSLVFLAAFSLVAEPLRLGPGEYNWEQLSVRGVPSGVDCRFRVLEGGATVHMQIMSMSQFRLFSRGREYEALDTAPDSRQGEIRRVVDESGEYVVVVANEERSPIALVDLEVSTVLNPDPSSTARVLSPGRRLAVILISFGIFFSVITWTALRLLRVAKTARA